MEASIAFLQRVYFVNHLEPPGLVLDLLHDGPDFDKVSLAHGLSQPVPSLGSLNLFNRVISKFQVFIRFPCEAVRNGRRLRCGQFSFLQRFSRLGRNILGFVISAKIRRFWLEPFAEWTRPRPGPMGVALQVRNRAVGRIIV